MQEERKIKARRGAMKRLVGTAFLLVLAGIAWMLRSPVSNPTEIPPDALAPRSLSLAKAIAEIRPTWIERAFTTNIVAEGLNSPDGIAIHPLTGDLYVSEEDISRIVRMSGDQIVRVIDRETPIYRDGIRVAPLVFPEGIAFGTDGALYTVEDVPGGRMISFAMNEQGVYAEGQVIPIPGGWTDFAWESVDVGPQGELLLAGSDAEAMTSRESMSVFTGVLLYRDREGTWWIPYRRFFGSFSEVRFSKSMKQALYTCEVTGEVGWLDLSSRFTLNGHSSFTAHGAEGLAVLPDGTFIVVEEGGRLVHVDPASDRYVRIITGLSSLESALWDERHGRLLVTEDGTGRVLAFAPDVPYEQNVDMLMFATYAPSYSQQSVPSECPDYLARILAHGGLHYAAPTEPPVSFREFVARVPLIAADVEAIAVDSGHVIEDPVERVQFVVFEPNRMTFDVEGNASLSFAIFAVRTRSGKMVTTSALPVQMLSARYGALDFEAMGKRKVPVPQPAAVSVSGIGVASIQFLGMGRIPDYSLMLNPRNPMDSYMVVFQLDGTREHYRLDTSDALARENWVIGYANIRNDEWVRLSPTPEERYQQSVARTEGDGL